MNVLIIDDNVDILNLLELLIGSTGNQVDVANNGKKGLDMIRDNKYDLILLDITMPEFSGFSILENLMESKNLENNKILFFTATSISDKALQKWYDVGVKGCLRKPIEPNELFEKINEVIHS